MTLVCNQEEEEEEEGGGGGLSPDPLSHNSFDQAHSDLNSTPYPPHSAASNHSGHSPSKNTLPGISTQKESSLDQQQKMQQVWIEARGCLDFWGFHFFVQEGMDMDHIHPDWRRCGITLCSSDCAEILTKRISPSLQYFEMMQIQQANLQALQLQYSRALMEQMQQVPSQVPPTTRFWVFGAFIAWRISKGFQGLEFLLFAVQCSGSTVERP